MDASKGANFFSNEQTEMRVESFCRDLQASIVAEFENNAAGNAQFEADQWVRPEGGGGITRVIQGDPIFEKVGIGFSVVSGKALPQSASSKRGDIAGQPFTAMGVSLVAHPRSPMVPTSHMNVRYFRTQSSSSGEPVWWFGGGYDLTPYYPYKEDCEHWHNTAKKACMKHFSEDVYVAYKEWCDSYFYIKHRNACRGIGGIFYDDLKAPDFETCFAFMQSVGNSFSQAYFPIVKKRVGEAYGERERNFQLYRRGRYVEFNLVYDRGTLFGLQSGGRVESILMSLPPVVNFEYGFVPEPGSKEAELESHFLKPRDWATI
jgi:coproporphyrinogen III oxidase